MARKKIIAGNWKMNMTPSEAVELVEDIEAAGSKRRSRCSILRTGNRHHSGSGGCKRIQYPGWC